MRRTLAVVFVAATLAQPTFLAACTATEATANGDGGVHQGDATFDAPVTPPPGVDATPDGSPDASPPHDGASGGLPPGVDPSECPEFVATPGDAGPVKTGSAPFCASSVEAFCSPPEASAPVASAEATCAADWETALINAASVTCRRGFHATAMDCGAYHLVEVTNVDASWESYFDKMTGSLVAVTGASTMWVPNGGGYCINCKGGPADFVPVVGCSEPRDLCARADGGTDAACPAPPVLDCTQAVPEAGACSGWPQLFDGGPGDASYPVGCTTTVPACSSSADEAGACWCFPAGSVYTGSADAAAWSCGF